MNFIFEVARWLHVISGFLAVLILWIPMVTRKGSKLHRGAGKVFVAAMATIALSAFYMGSYRILGKPHPEADATSFSWFLIFIAVLSGATVWYGVRVLRFKKRNDSHRILIDRLFPILLLVTSFGMIAYGWTISFPLLQYFPIVGVFLGGTQLLYWLSKPKVSSHWVVEHIIGMLSSCVAVITAFIVFGAPRLLQIDSVSLLLWFLPTIVFLPLIIGFTIYYGKKFASEK